MRTVLLTVGKAKAPFTGADAHYLRLLDRYQPVELVECREDEQVARRIPKRAHVTLLSTDGTQHDSVGFARVLEERRRPLA